MTNHRDELLGAILRAIPSWQVLVVQFNDTIADRLSISTSDMQCLFVLSRQGPSTPGAIAEAIGINNGSASRMVDRLLAAGLVTRTADEQDRRRVIVNVTQEALDRIARYYDPLNASLLEHLGHMDDHALSQMLAFINEAEKTTDQHLRNSNSPAVKS